MAGIYTLTNSITGRAAQKRDNSHLQQFAFRPGFKHTDEAKLRMSIDRKGIPKSSEHREKLRVNLAKARAARLAQISTNIVAMY